MASDEMESGLAHVTHDGTLTLHRALSQHCETRRWGNPRETVGLDKNSATGQCEVDLGARLKQEVDRVGDLGFFPLAVIAAIWASERRVVNPRRSPRHLPKIRISEL
ncbi:hypothetical protein B0H17DRAFT_1127862 [Mycena rosella]|uniref:Uncharacterized protein n=1 Tax=Mycena rosella TaxID=1033263 RepID=A0AAD7GMP7_MYCRO|nr:hypothetical protein B0H17DRAFT_1127862 [Mycena rosella]